MLIFFTQASLIVLDMTLAENCHGIEQCGHVICDSMYELECLHGECTCSHRTYYHFLAKNNDFHIKWKYLV